MRNQLLLLLLLNCFFASAQPKLMLNVGGNRSKVTPDFTFHSDTVNKTVTQRTGLRFGFSAFIPMDKQNRFVFNPGIQYSQNGSKVQQTFDTSQVRFFYIITEQKINYINVPLQVLYQVPLKGKTRFMIGAGPQLSLFYNGEIKVTSLDTGRKFKETIDKDPLVGNAENKYRSLYLAANAQAGFDFGKVNLMFHYSKGLSSFYKDANKSHKFNNVGITLGIGLTKDPNKKPIVKDKDGDGIPDKEDACPETAGSTLTKGCPDQDGDGIPDKEDKCRTISGLKKYNGCPIPDTDGDGSNDEEDKCPSVKGTKTNNGCPDQETPPVKPQEKENVVVNEKAIEQINFKASQIQFRFRSAELTQESYKLLDEIAALLKNSDQPVSVEGHSSLEGNPRSNMALSEERAATVKKYLVSKGITEGRISSKGFGSTQPIIKGTTEKANIQNRRVEIKLLN
jgi:outer membrane protein OmpA-like peptidoglycan-associated protein